jgi:outer membrane lipoprotein carrier protein
MRPSKNQRVIGAVLAVAMALAAACDPDEHNPAPGTAGATSAATTAPTSTVALPEDTDEPIIDDAPPPVTADPPPPVPSASAAAKTAPPKTKDKTPPPTTSGSAVAVAPPPPEPAQPPPTPTEPVPPAESGSADEVAEKVDAVFKPVTRFRARFDQKYTAKMHGTEKKSSGVLYVERPGKLSISYHDPNKNRVVSDGATLKIYEHDNGQMFVKPVKNTEYPGAFSFIMGKGLRSSFTFTFQKESKWEGGPVLIGTPRVPNPGYKKVIFYIDEELLKKGDLGCVRRVLVLDAQSNRNRFDFIHAEEPDTIPVKEFTFEAPPGTEIIEG